jgi:hypothetical protein
MNVDDFIQDKLKNKKNVIRLKNYQVEILKILDSGLTVRDVYSFLSENYPELEKMSERHLYEFVRKLKKSPEQNTDFKKAEAGQAEPEKPISPVGQIKAAIPETIQPNTENPPVNLQEKFKEHLAKVRSENSAEPIEKNTGAQIQRRSKSVLKPEKVDEWQEHRKKMGLPNTIDDEWRTKPEEE